MAGNQSPSGQNPSLGPNVSALAEGQKVFEQRYTLMKIVGRSPTSVVWLAWDQKQDKDVALKFIPEMVKEDGSAVATLKREIRKLHDELKHAQIVPIQDLECSGTMVAIVSEYVEGASLNELREQRPNKVFAPQELSDWLQQLIAVLSHAHSELGVSHGDLTTANLIITKKGQLRVTGFCMAGYINEFLTRTGNPGAITANIPYYSPQRAAGAPNNYLDDIYAVGAILYELLTSKPPFYTGDLMLQVQHKVAPPMVHRRKELRVIGEPISRIWEETIATCLAKDPAARPQNIQDLVAKLELEAAPTADVQEAAPPPPPPNNKPMVIAAVAVIVLIAIVGLLLGRGSKPTGPAPKEVIKIVEKEETPEEKKKREADKKRLAEAEANAKKMKAEMEKIKADEAKRAAELKKQTEEAAKIADQKGKELALMQAQLKQQQEAAAKERKDAEERLKQKMTTGMSDAEKKAAADAEKKAEAAAKKAKELEATVAKMQKDEEERKKKEKMASDDAVKKKREADERMAALLQAQELERRRMDELKRAEVLMAKKREDEERLKQEAAKREAEEKAKQAAFASKKFDAGKVWENTIGIRLVPMGKISIAAFETRLADFDAFVREKRYNAGNGFKSPGFRQENDGHPVVNVSWSDAKAFCSWLTEKEVKAGLLPADYAYRLPSDAEWSSAVALDKDVGATPAERAGKTRGVFPWGNVWPPPPGAGNYTDKITFDQYENTAPVGSFKPNKIGIFDLGGNVWEWCEDWSDSTQKSRVLRGGSFYSLIFATSDFESGSRRFLGPEERKNDCGFRVVLDKK